MDEVGKSRAGGDGYRSNIADIKTRLKLNHCKWRHVIKVVSVEWPYGKTLFWGIACLGASLKCLYTSACSMGSKQEELEVFVQLQDYDFIGIMETWWDVSHAWSTVMDGYSLFRKNRQGR